MATRVPSLLRITVGTSASVTNQALLEATVFAAVHAPFVSSENFNVVEASACSSQLRMTPRSDRVSCGCPESPCAGTWTDSTAKGNADSVEGAGDGLLERHAVAGMMAASTSTARTDFIPTYSS